MRYVRTPKETVEHRLMRLIETVQQLTRRAAEAQRVSQDRDYWHFVPIDHRVLMRALDAAVSDYNKRTRCDSEGWRRVPRFLDVGCGPGNIMAIAEAYEFRVFGIEREAKYLLANHYCRHRTLRGLQDYAKSFKDGPIVYGDALECEEYGEFDVVYLYQPIRKEKLCQELERRVHDQMKRGAILINFLKTLDISQDKRFKYVGKTPRWPNDCPVWRKISL